MRTLARCFERLTITTAAGMCAAPSVAHLLWLTLIAANPRIASIDFKHPLVASGSSDKHVRLVDIYTRQGWSTSPELTPKPPGDGRTAVCDACGSNTTSGEAAPPPPRRRAHEDLVRSVALSSELVVSGSYDFTVKVRAAGCENIGHAKMLTLLQVWDRQTGALIADLAGGHTGRIFCVGFDCTKVCCSNIAPCLDHLT